MRFLTPGHVGALLALPGVVNNPYLPKTNDHTLGHELRDAIVIGLLAIAALTSACHHEESKGPMQKAGESVDHAAEKTKDAVKGGADGVKDGAKKDDH